MISRFAEKAVDYYTQNGTIPMGDKDLYIYGFFLLFSNVFFFTLTAFFGFLFHIPLESMLFYFMFAVIRSYAGGLHASKESICTVSTAITLLLSVSIIHFLEQNNLIISPLVTIFFCLIVIGILAPIDSEEKRLTKQERQKYKKKSIVIGAVIACIGIILYNRSNIFYSSTVTLVLESLLLILGKFKTHKN